MFATLAPGVVPARAHRLAARRGAPASRGGVVDRAPRPGSRLVRRLPRAGAVRRLERVARRHAAATRAAIDWRAWCSVAGPEAASRWWCAPARSRSRSKRCARGGCRPSSPRSRPRLRAAARGRRDRTHPRARAPVPARQLRDADEHGVQVLVPGLAAARVRRRGRHRQRAAWQPRCAGARGRVAALLALLAIVPGLYYPATALWSRTGGFGSEQPTLDALAWLERFRPEELAALRWLRESTRSDDVVVQRSGASYRAEQNLPSIVTGRPRCWAGEGHEYQWRGSSFSSFAAGREEAIERIYRPPSAERARLDAAVVGRRLHLRGPGGKEPLRSDRGQRERDRRRLRPGVRERAGAHLPAAGLTCGAPACR